MASQTTTTLTYTSFPRINDAPTTMSGGLEQLRRKKSRFIPLMPPEAFLLPPPTKAEANALLQRAGVHPCADFTANNNHIDGAQEAGEAEDPVANGELDDDCVYHLPSSLVNELDKPIAVVPHAAPCLPSSLSTQQAVSAGVPFYSPASSVWSTRKSTPGKTAIHMHLSQFCAPTTQDVPQLDTSPSRDAFPSPAEVAFAASKALARSRRGRKLISRQQRRQNKPEESDELPPYEEAVSGESENAWRGNLAASDSIEHIVSPTPQRATPYWDAVLEALNTGAEASQEQEEQLSRQQQQAASQSPAELPNDSRGEAWDEEASVERVQHRSRISDVGDFVSQFWRSALGAC